MQFQRFSILFAILCITTTALLAQDAIRHLSHEDAVKAAVAKPQPEYPTVARQLRIQGRI